MVEDSPLCLGYSEFTRRLEGKSPFITLGTETYRIPTSCSETRHKVPYGLGQTMVSNSIVMMFPDVNQYLVSSELRKPSPKQVGFLCCTSSVSSAAQKGLIRFATPRTTCRCYNSGVGRQVEALIEFLRARGCSCDGRPVSVMIAGLTVFVCQDCSTSIATSIQRYSTKSPHCLTLHPRSNGYVISFCTGALMRNSGGKEGAWVDGIWG
jgi:hypothetical protein